MPSNSNAQGDPTDSTQRFSTRVRDYVAHRPDYPAECLREIASELPRDSVAADIGAGTGIFARALADMGLVVHAVEPNAAMRGAAEPHPLITWHDATGESTGLAAASVHLITCAQAFHWLKPDKAIREFARIATAGARLAVIWNTVNTDDPASDGYRRTLERHADELPKSPAPEQAVPLATGATQGSAAFASPTIKRFPHQQRLDRAGLLGRAFSSSYVPMSSTPAGEALAADLHRLFDEHQRDGAFTLRYQTIAILSRRLSA